MLVKPAFKGLIVDDKEPKLSRITPNVHGVYTPPEASPNPLLLCWSESTAATLGIEKSPDWIQALSGNKLLPGMNPISTRYGGHQFGQWAGQLGDGRAICLGEIQTGSQNYEIQIKGAGITPYSRFADGKAVLRSSLREYICSEAMHYLGVPTTRALALVTTGEEVMRDILYDGNPKFEPGAICTRVAQSFLRFGHFQIFAASGETAQLKQLLDYTLKHYYPGKTIDEFFDELVRSTAHLISEWLRVGFVHGVMNTDNMSILGLTIDYGPYGWIDNFDPDWTPNTTDATHRRYRFSNQSNIAHWNLHRLAEALMPFSSNLISICDRYPQYFKESFENMMSKKLGLCEFDLDLTEDLFSLLHHLEADMTLFFRKLSSELESENTPSTDKIDNDWLEVFYLEPDADQIILLNNWLHRWRTLISRQNAPIAISKAKMDGVNPIFIPRNYIIQMALDDLEKGDSIALRSSLHSLEKAIQTPYELNLHTRPFFKKRPDWAINRPGCSMLSCSS